MEEDSSKVLVLADDASAAGNVSELIIADSVEDDSLKALVSADDAGNAVNEQTLVVSDKLTIESNVAQNSGVSFVPETRQLKASEVICVDSGNEDSMNDADKTEIDENAPRIGMRFRNYDEAVAYYKQYALDAGFGSIILKSSYNKSGSCRRLVIGCSRAGRGRANPITYLFKETMKINCPARISLKLRADRRLHIDSVILDHNHPMSPSAAKLMSQPMSEAAARIKGRRNIPIADKEHGNITEIGQLKFGEGDDESIYRFFTTMQNKNPNFFYLVDLDKNGRLKNIFWSDAQSRSAHEYFGHDVIYFDTTYITDGYDLPLAYFMGVNHHGHSVLFGCGLLSDQSFESFVWLFRVFLICMKERHPGAIITEQNEALVNAVKNVFPSAKHRLCLSRVMNEISENLKTLADFKTVKKALKRAIYDSLRSSDFEVEWSKAGEEYGLTGQEWFSSLYAVRHMWVPLYLRNSFWAGMSVSQRGVSAVSFFDRYVYPKTSLKQFFGKYEIILENKYKTAAQADQESFQKNPLTTKFRMEEQLSKVYTINMFRKFQEELKATMYCDAMFVKDDGVYNIYEVKECSYLEDGKKTNPRTHEVRIHKNDLMVDLGVECLCGSFLFNGILCSHALSVLKLLEVFELPPRYVLDRWKKDYKKLHASAHFSDDMIIDSVDDEYLFSSSLHLINMAFISEGRYLVALKLLREAEKTLLDDVSVRQGRLFPFETQMAGNGISDGGRNSQLAKRRGRPPKKVQDANAREQDFLGSSFVANEANMYQPGHASPHIEMGIPGGINLMEDIPENDMSYEAHYGIDVGPPHQVGQQRMQSNFLQVPQDHQSMGTQSAMQHVYQMMHQRPQDEHLMNYPQRRAG